MPATTSSAPVAIYDKAASCHSLFQTVASSLRLDGSERALGKPEIRFRRWAKVLKVWYKDASSLDSKLDASRQGIRELVNLQLDNLEQCLETVREASNSLSKTEFQDIIHQINTQLDKMELVATALVFHTEEGFSRRVFVYRLENPNQKFANAVKDHVWEEFPIIHSKPPPTTTPPFWARLGMKLNEGNASNSARAVKTAKDEPEGLYGALVETTLIRYYRIKYEKDTREERLAPVPADIAAWRLPPSPAPSSAHKTLAASPKNGSSQDVANCPICGVTLGLETFQGTAWLEHFTNDVKPYVCLDDCCTNNNVPLFADRDEWKTHMREYHGQMWISDLQQPRRWICPVCSCVSPQDFPSEEATEADFLIHLEKVHDHKLKEDTRKSTRGHNMLCPRPSDTCPICGIYYGSKTGAGGPDSGSTNGAAGHLPGDSSSESDDDDPNSPQRIAHEKAVDCIGNHLWDLAEFFTCGEFLPGSKVENMVPLLKRKGSSIEVESRQLDPRPPKKRGRPAGVVKSRPAGESGSSSKVKPRRSGHAGSGSYEGAQSSERIVPIDGMPLFGKSSRSRKRSLSRLQKVFQRD